VLSRTKVHAGAKFTKSGQGLSTAEKPHRARLSGSDAGFVIQKEKGGTSARASNADHGYSYRKASIGFSRDAFRAGKKPDTIPTRERIVNEMIITPIDACRKIAPSWSAVL